LDDLIGQILRIAQPVVQDLVKGIAAGGGAPAPAASGAISPPGIITQILQGLLSATTAPAPTALPKGSPAAAPASANGTAAASRNQSLPAGNRFTDENCRHSDNSYSKSLIFGIDDALIGALAGPIIQILPQLMNAANQRKIEIKKADDQLIGGIIS